MKIRRSSDHPAKVVVIIGAGIGGLSAAAALARLGVDVTVLEAHVYPGGCAGTFYHQGFRFDAGATLAGGFYPGGPMDLLAGAAGVEPWRYRPAELAMTVHLPGGMQVHRYSDERRQEGYRLAFGDASLDFWRWQERTADAVWALALRSPDWPPQTLDQVSRLAAQGLGWLANDIRLATLPSLLLDAFRPISSHLHHAPAALRQFVDAQLLISAQATSQHANALYAAAALDLPRRGVVHLEGGIGAIAEALVQAIRLHGGRVLYRHEVTRIITRDGKPVAVQSKRGDIFDADILIANLTPWSLDKLMGNESGGPRLHTRAFPGDAWGAFVVYLGIDAGAIPAGSSLHHQVVAQEPLGEGNSVFLSISPEWDQNRAPAGRRAVTLSTHTRLEPWWRLYAQDRQAYERLKQRYAEKMLANAEIALPGIREAAVLALPGTPVTFNTFTRRYMGWVGGFPQTSLLRASGPRLSKHLWMVGDSIFPGQSTAAVALGGLRVAAGILREMHFQPQPDADSLQAVHAVSPGAREI
jgi:C-3',4' desaturase CrtD